MILKIIAFVLLGFVALLVFSFCAGLIVVPMMALLTAVSRVSQGSRLACGPFSTALSLCVLGLWIFLTVVPLLCVFSRSARRWYRGNVVRVFLWNLKVGKGLVVGFVVCLFLGWVGMPVFFTVMVGLVVTLSFLSEGFRSGLLTVLGYVFPPRVCGLFVRNPEVTLCGNAVLLRTRCLFGYWTVAFVKIGGIPPVLEGVDRLRDVLFGAFDIKMPFGYCVRFGERFHVYFYTGVRSYFDDGSEEVLERLSVLRQTISSRLPELDVDVLGDPDEVKEVISLPDDAKIRVRNRVLEMDSKEGRWYFSVLRVRGLPAYKGEERFSSLIETF